MCIYSRTKRLVSIFEDVANTHYLESHMTRWCGIMVSEINVRFALLTKKSSKYHIMKFKSQSSLMLFKVNLFLFFLEVNSYTFATYFSGYLIWLLNLFLYLKIKNRISEKRKCRVLSLIKKATFETQKQKIQLKSISKILAKALFE